MSITQKKAKVTKQKTPSGINSEGAHSVEAASALSSFSEPYTFSDDSSDATAAAYNIRVLIYLIFMRMD
jgi:hypothetical protein